MTLQIRTLDVFDKQVKRLAKKYKKLAHDLRSLKTTLQDNPEAGVELGNGCYKIRLENSSAATGKRGGFRVVYYYLDDRKRLYLMSIYSKTGQSTISDARLLNILRQSGLLD